MLKRNFFMRPLAIAVLASSAIHLPAWSQVSFFGGAPAATHSSVSTGGAPATSALSGMASAPAPGTEITAPNATPFDNRLSSNNLNDGAGLASSAKAAPTKTHTEAPAAENAPAKGAPKSQALSQFQVFVQQATGKALPIYGESLFSQPEAYRVESSGPAPADYVLGPGDEVQLQVWGGADFVGTLTVDRNGQVQIPRVGPATVAGVRFGELNQVLRAQIGKMFTNFEVNASMGKLRSMQVYVVGQARQPGSYTLPSLSTLANALFASGGPNPQGSMRNIQLKRKGKVVSTLDLYAFIHDGDKTHDSALQPGDVIVIPPAGPRVAITGALDQAAIYELKPQGETSLGEILRLGGGASVLANTQKALIETVTPGATPPRQVQDLALNAKGLQRPLHDADIVTLLGISPAFGNAVTLQGNVAAPLRYQWFPGMRIKDLIPEENALITSDYYQRKNLLVQSIAPTSAQKAGHHIEERVRSMVDQINWDYAVIERLDKTQLRTQLIPFHLGRAVLQGDTSQNLELQPGDVVTIMSQKDLKLPEARQTRLVRIEGEVAAPGLYEVQPGETLPQLIRRIGGVTPQAYIFGTEFERVSVRERQQENLDMLIRRLEGQQQSQILFLLANRNASDAAGSAALIEQQRHMAERQLQAMRRLRSNGRITLELNPEQALLDTLPQLALEDGDRIVIPNMPSFISAVGAIHNENVFIYKAGRTVSDVIKVAGLREEADADEMFVLRADGSIIGKSSTSFFGNIGSVRLMPGDTVVVPEKLDRESTRNFVMRQFKDVTQILSQFGLGVAAIKAIKNL